MKGLTDKQKQILDFINEFGRTEGMAPTINEISAHFGVTAATAFAHVRALQRKGLLNRSSKARSISLPGMQNMHHFSMNLSIPLLGRISAGVPGETEEHVERYITLDPSLLSRKIEAGAKLFAVKVHGESMRDAGILDGDQLASEASLDPAELSVALSILEINGAIRPLGANRWSLR